MSVPYPLFPHHATHPDHLRALGRWMGVPVATEGPVRVLEIGGAAGANVLPMAVRNPDWTVVGVDLAAHEIARGQRLAEAAGAGNLSLRCADVSQVDDLGTFDVIVGHGLLSWVPPAVAEAILALLGTSLAPGGVAYLSYNVAQGWSHRGRLRDWLMARVRGIDDEQARVDEARRWLPEAPAEVAALAAEVAQEADAYISQDYLATFNEAFHYEELVGRARGHGLEPLCDANALSLSLGAPWLPAARAAAEAVGDDPVARAAWSDAQQGRAFRSTVFARAADRGPRRGPEGSWLTTELRPVDGAPVDQPGPTTFAHAWGARATIADPNVKGLLGQLASAWPQAVPFAQLARSLGGAAEPLVSVLVGSNLVHPRTGPGSAVRLGSTPEVPRDVRILAAEGATWAADAHHRGRRLDDRDRALLPLLNGLRSAGSIGDELGWDEATVTRELTSAADRGLRLR